MMTETLHVGLERTPITPPVGTRQIGYYGRAGGAEFIYDDLYATAMVFAQGETKLALVSCDLLFIHPSMVARIRAEVEELTGIPAANVMLCCTHTHSGPITYATDQQSDGDRAYLENLIHLVAGAVRSADGQLQPAKLAVGRATCDIGVNRREKTEDGRIILGINEAGPTDPEVLVLRVDSREGYPLALWANYACHAVVLGSQSLGLSADWPGAMREVVEEALGVTCAFLQGACADINPRRGPLRDYGVVRQLGTAAAGAVIQAWATAVELEDEPSLAAARRAVRLPIMDTASEDLTPGQRYAEAHWGKPWREFAVELDQHFPWSAQVIQEGGGYYVEAELQALRLGDVAIVACPAEPFVQIGLGVKGRSPVETTIFAGYSNGCVGYIPMPDAYVDGGYEVDTSYVYYHLPASLDLRCAGIVEDAAVEMLKGLG